MGMLEMGSCYLPTTKKWLNYIERTENTYNNTNKQIQDCLINIINNTLKEGQEKGLVYPFYFIFYFVILFCYFYFLFYFYLFFIIILFH